MEGEKLSQKLHRLKELCVQSEVSVKSLVEAINEGGLAFLTLIFSFPFLLPVPIPGLSVIFGLIIFLAGAGLFREKGPWLPQKLLEKKISAKLLSKILEGGLKICHYLEKITRTRGGALLRHSPWIRKLSGLLIGVCGLFLALPLPPGTNFPPASSIIFLSLGLLEEDLLMIFTGHCLFIFNIFLFGGIFYLGFDGLRSLLT